MASNNLTVKVNVERKRFTTFWLLVCWVLRIHKFPNFYGWLFPKIVNIKYEMVEQGERPPTTEYLKT